MRYGSWVRPRGAAAALTGVLLVCGCGGDAGLSISNPTGQCIGGTGAQIEGTVRMPRGRVAQAGSAAQRFASAIWSQAAAIDGNVSPVGAGAEVTLVELREEDVANGTEPGPLEIATTDENGQYCIRLPGGTDHNVCRYMVQVGNRDDRTLTRAFLFSSSPGDDIDIDFQSEATVRVILAQIPPATLCDFSPDEIRNIYNAVRIAPGTADGENADEINAVAASIAAADPVVNEAVSAAYNRPGTPTASPTPGAPSATPTGPAPTRTAGAAGTATFTPAGTGTADLSTRTPTPQDGNPTATRPATRTPTPA
jgi:hypothetical protein